MADYSHRFDTPNYGAYQVDATVETYDTKLSNDLDIVIRHGFIRKVFAIVGAQLILTAAIATPFYFYQETWMQPGNIGNVFCLVLASSALTMGLMCYMSYKPEVGRQYPKNYIILSLITVGMGCMVGLITMHFTAASIMICVGMTAALCVGLMGFAMQTKYDFTGAGPFLFAALMAFMLLGIFLMFVGGGIAHKIYAGCGALLYSFYFILDTQLIVGGRHKKHKFCVDDYVFGALTLYLDMINLFVQLLKIFGEKKNK